MNREINTDIASGIIGLALTAGFFFSLEDISWLSILFPKTIILFMGLISASLVVKGFIMPSRSQIFNVGSNTRWLVTALLLFLWVMLMPVVGFFVSTVVFMTAIVAYLAHSRTKVTPRKLLVWIPVIVGEVTFFYLIFTKLLHVPLPRGLFF